MKNDKNNKAIFKFFIGRPHLIAAALIAVTGHVYIAGAIAIVGEIIQLNNRTYRYWKTHTNPQSGILLIRWIAYLAVGHPHLVLSAIAAAAGYYYIAGAIAVAGEILELVKIKYRYWGYAWAFRRSFPLRYYDTQAHAPGANALDTAYTPLAYPKIGMRPKITNTGVEFTIRPATGKSLKDLEASAFKIAAQYPRILEIQVRTSGMAEIGEDIEQLSASRGMISLIMRREEVKEEETVTDIDIDDLETIEKPLRKANTND